jgi:hypothetical protein
MHTRRIDSVLLNPIRLALTTFFLSVNVLTLCTAVTEMSIIYCLSKANVFHCLDRLKKSVQVGRPVTFCNVLISVAKSR